MTNTINPDAIKSVLSRSISNSDIFEVLLDNELLCFSEATYGQHSLDMMQDDEYEGTDYCEYVQLSCERDAKILNEAGEDIVIHPSYGCWWLRQSFGQAWLMDFGIND